MIDLTTGMRGRMPRIEELAKEAYGPGARIRHNAGAWLVEVDQGDRVVEELSVAGLPHPKGLDAFEAALLIMAGEVTLRAVEHAMLPRTMDEPQVVLTQQQNAMRELAAAWDARVLIAEKAFDMDSARTLAHCAHELRLIKQWRRLR